VASGWLPFCCRNLLLLRGVDLSDSSALSDTRYDTIFYVHAEKLTDRQLSASHRTGKRKVAKMKRNCGPAPGRVVNSDIYDCLVVDLLRSGVGGSCFLPTVTFPPVQHGHCRRALSGPPGGSTGLRERSLTSTLALL